MGVRLFLLSGALGLALITTIGSAQEQATQDSPSETPEEAIRETPMGALCWAAIVEGGYQVASRCDLGEDAASAETLRAYEKARDDLAKRFLSAGWSEDMLETFRARQGNAEAPTELLCAFDKDDNDTGAFLVSLAQFSPEAIEETTQSVLAKPGHPVWGTCL